MMQLSPAQFPGAAAEAGARQVFVYRFPAGLRLSRSSPTQIQPEVGVSRDRHLRTRGDRPGHQCRTSNWICARRRCATGPLPIPADYTVVSVTGATSTDYAPETEAAGRLSHLEDPVRQSHRRAAVAAIAAGKEPSRRRPATGGCRHCGFPARSRCVGMSAPYRLPGYRIVPAHGGPAGRGAA